MINARVRALLFEARWNRWLRYCQGMLLNLDYRLAARYVREGPEERLSFDVFWWRDKMREIWYETGGQNYQDPAYRAAEDRYDAACARWNRYYRGG